MARIIASVSAEAVARKYMPPVLRGLESWHFLNDSLEKVARNYAPGKPDAKIVGTPVVNQNFTAFKGLLNFLQTDFTESLNATCFVVARTTANLSTEATRPMYFGTFRNPPADNPAAPTTYGISLSHISATQITGFASRGTEPVGVSAPASVALVNPDEWGLYCLTVREDAGPNTHIWDLTRNISGASAANHPARYPSMGKFRIGSGFTTYTGECDLALFAGYSVELNDAEREATAANIRAYIWQRGIVA